MDDIFRQTFDAFRDELINKKRFNNDWSRYCGWGGTSGGKDQPEFPVNTIGSFTTLLGVANWRPVTHEKTVTKNKGLFTLLSLAWRNRG
jgi:hypothetical protein